MSQSPISFANIVPLTYQWQVYQLLQKGTAQTHLKTKTTKSSVFHCLHMNIINWPYQTHWTLQHLPNPNQPLEVQLVAGWILGSWSEIENHLYQNGQMGLLIETGQNSKPTCIYIYTHILFFKSDIQFTQNYTSAAALPKLGCLNSRDI